jgi:hypothetical protein
MMPGFAMVAATSYQILILGGDLVERLPSAPTQAAFIDGASMA